MKRDFDLIRRILLLIESDQKGIDILSLNNAELCASLSVDKGDALGHLKLLVEAGFVNGGNGWLTSSGVNVSGLSWHGHEFLDTIRDEEIWKRTKEGAKSVGSFSIDVIKDVAKAVINKKIIEWTNGEFGFGGSA
ncbi:MAG: hypothetical protein C0457_19985 [Polymorphum sp.]|nr:hypothetical protein [Polymorphum sp.]